jgi:Raf kinase inhibitor-like YbhB/YbcL family protein
MKRMRLTSAGLLGAVAVGCGLLVALGPSATATPTPSVQVVVAKRPALDASLPRFTVTLPDIPAGGTFGPAQEISGLGCTGQNLSPALSWHGAPAATQSYLITMFDEDAPTSSGFWHWTVWNIPATTTSLPQGAGTTGQPGLPATAVSGNMDLGFAGYGGPCPPVGDGVHHYVISVVALSVADLGTPQTLPSAAIQASMRSDALAVATREVDFSR